MQQRERLRPLLKETSACYHSLQSPFTFPLKETPMKVYFVPKGAHTDSPHAPSHAMTKKMVDYLSINSSF